MEYVEMYPIKNEEVDTFVEDCNLFAVFDAPVNVLFSKNLISNIKKYKDIFVNYKMDNNIFFSCKSNKSLAFLKICAMNGCGIEVSSIYELKDALKFTNKIISSGPAKTVDFLELSIDNDAIISVDDLEELKKIREINKFTKVFLRMNDVVDNMTSRFGINIGQINECLRIIKSSKIEIIGFSFHINNYNLDDRIYAIRKIIELSEKHDIKIKYIDIGGGFPSNYCNKENYEKFLKRVNPNMFFKHKKFNDFYTYYSDISNEKSLEYILSSVSSILNDIQIIIEPGRSLLNNCGISIYKVEYLKKLPNGERILVTNGNINCLSEQWFNTDYLIEPILYKRNKDSNKIGKPIFASVAGNLCLEQDMITWRKIKFDYLPEPGDYLIYYNTAGYQMDSIESNFHKIPLVKKFVVEKVDNEYEIRDDDKDDC